MEEEFFVILTYQGNEYTVKIEDPTSTVQEILNKIINGLNLSKSDGRGKPANYFLGRINDDNDEILWPIISGENKNLLDYNVKSGDRLTLTMIPTAGGRVEVPKSLKDKQFWRNVIKFQYIYSLIGLFVGLGIVILGVFLFLKGVTGNSTWKTVILGFESNITNATPGVVLFITGLFVIWITKYSVKSKNF